MAEILNGNNVKTIAFYLPQFHAIPENDKAWGKGFTEWTNTRAAKPLFEGHHQPRTPLNNNYYNLLDDDVKIWQADLAKKYGLFGFCYYHYWFKGGKKLLEKPLEQMLANKNVDIPFCLSWANENWSKLWDGGNKELIVEQDYGGEKEWDDHLKYMVEFFKDDRYITLDGKPVFLIYKPEIIPNVKEMLDFWSKKILDYGFKGICFMIQGQGWYFSPSYDMSGFDYQIKFQPFSSLSYSAKSVDKVAKSQKLYRTLKKLHLNNIYYSLRNYAITKHRAKKQLTQRRLDYDKVWQTIIDSETKPYLIEGAFVDWDNTARKKNGYMHLGTTPEKFEKYMTQLINKVKVSNEQPIIFINAWNEWAEGTYLEPDDKNEYKYLEALNSALNKDN